MVHQRSGRLDQTVLESTDSDCSDPGEATVDDPLVDCDDTLASVNPGAEEIEGDGLDQDCDGIDPGGDGVASDDTASPSDGDDTPIEVTVDMDAPTIEMPPEKGGCSTAGRAPTGLGWAGLLGMGILLGFRRRE